MIAVVVVIIPVAVGMPAMVVFVPPALIGGPAAFTLRLQLVAPMVGLVALSPVMLDSFVQLVIDFGDSHLAIIVGVHGQRDCGEGEQSRQGDCRQ